MYTVCGYDKDNGVYDIYLETDNLEDAKQLGRNLEKLVQQDCLCREVDGLREPIDWIEIVDTQNNDIVYWVSYEED